jgi:pimeloyl-ACP methyl ester carboxylesterase
MRIHRDNVALGYDDAGRGDPPMLLVHGWGTDRAVFGPLFDHARRSRRVIAVDLRGFGESDAPEQPYSIEGYCDDLFFLAGQLGLEQPIVIGHSMGGIIALDFAARYADRISAAILLEAMVIADPLLAGLRPILEGVRTKAYRDVVSRLMTHLTGAYFDPGECERLVTFIASCPQHVLVSAMEGILAFDSVAAATNVKCPLLYVGTSATYTDVARFRALCPQLVTGQLVGCGHYFPMEVPDQLSAMVARFIETHVTRSQG